MLTDDCVKIERYFDGVISTCFYSFGIGRVFVLALVAVSILWIPMIQAAQGSQLFTYIQNITAYLAPPVCAVYLLAIFIPRINEQVNKKLLNLNLT